MVVHASGRKDVVAIAGGGIGGLAAGVALTQAGFECKIYESGSSLRNEGSAIGVWANGWAALDELGVGEGLRARYLPLQRIELCRGETGQTLRSFSLNECDPSGKFCEFRGVHRSSLIEALASKLPPGSISFSSSVDKVLKNNQENGVTISVSRDGKALNEMCSILVAADGARSQVAAGLGLNPPGYSGYIAYRGVAKIGLGQIPPLPLDTIRQLWGQGVRAGLYPLTQNEVYWFVTVNVAEESILSREGSEEWLRLALKAVENWDPSWGMQDLISSSPLETISRSRIADRWSLFGPWGEGCVTLCGDAMHPMSPNLGQGGCVAMEGAVSLARELLSSQNNDIEMSLRTYEKERARRCIPLTIRAGLMGILLQIDNSLICKVRDIFISSPLFSPSHFLDHVKYEH
jgi:2-polyprenyl-6-methoxyphenol hydroxylase-like FAD-dependent oxidoreductase